MLKSESKGVPLSDIYGGGPLVEARLQLHIYICPRTQVYMRACPHGQHVVRFLCVQVASFFRALPQKISRQ